MAVHVGQIHADDNGITGHALIHLFRLLDAPEFRRAFAASSDDLALVVSGYLYASVIRHGQGLTDPAAYQPIDIEFKETRTRAWIYHPAPLRGAAAIGSTSSVNEG
jgi:hypothetical protein